jgi:hypothetical protein
VRGKGVDMAIYKISYVILESDHPGGIANLDKKPAEGELLQIGELILEVIEVIELMPPRGDFHYIHTTCKIHKGN